LKSAGKDKDKANDLSNDGGPKDEAQPHPGVCRELKSIRQAIIARLLDWIDAFRKP
jgi:hypothetical protein